MSDQLDQVTTEPVSGVLHRVRPAQASADKRPCLLLLHGVGANEAGFIELARQLDPRLLVILARGPLVLGPGRFAWFQVNFTPAGPVIDVAQAEAARAKLLDFIGQLPGWYGVDPARIWVAGFSQGGIMSAGVGLSAPDRVAGFGVLSGRILPEVLPLVERGPKLASLQASVSHGVHDQTLGIHFAHQSRALLAGLGVPTAYREYAAGHALGADMAADFQRWMGAQLNTTHSVS